MDEPSQLDEQKPRLHWTYAEIADGSDLQQGDILQPHELRGLFGDVHKHFCDAKYLAFVVATQSCDLVRRGGPEEGGKYIALATVRSLAAVTPKLLGSLARPVAPGVFIDSVKDKAHKLFERIFNQNETALGLFYLHPHQSVGIAESAVAFLRVTVAVRREHYDLLVRARSGRLSDEFKARLGWLLGNLYSRPDTSDWSEHDGGSEELRKLLKQYLSTMDTEMGPYWLEDAKAKEAERLGVPMPTGNPEENFKALAALRPRTPKELGLDAIIAEVSASFFAEEPSADEQKRLAKLRSNLKNSEVLSPLFRAK